MIELNPNDQKFKDISQKEKFKYRIAIKASKNLGVKLSDAVKDFPEIVSEDGDRIVVKSLEGDTSFQKDDYLFFQDKGKGKYWGVAKDIAEDPKRYITEETDNPKFDKVFIPISPVNAWKVPFEFFVTTPKGKQVSEKDGGWLLQSFIDKDDIWISSNDDFKNYKIIKGEI